MIVPSHPETPRGRLAPSPTGHIHLGNAWSFWAAWLAAKSRGGSCVLRLEDIDPARAKPEYTGALLRDLSWLGISWDNEPGPLFRQSERADAYDGALELLRAKGVVYPCYCTRKELRDIAGAPHVDDAGAPYPGLCRTLTKEQRAAKEAEGRRHSLRLFCPLEVPWHFTDRIVGEMCMTLGECGGDFALRRSDGVYAYQLAVVVDDIAMGVTQVVRGNDILASTPRQLYLYSLLGASPPEYAHLPLVADADGERLAKRHAALTLATLRDAGVRAETLLGWLATASGLREAYAPMAAPEGQACFSWEKIRPEALRLPADPVQFFLRLQHK